MPVLTTSILPRWFLSQWFTDSLVVHDIFYFLQCSSRGAKPFPRKVLPTSMLRPTLAQHPIWTVVSDLLGSSFSFTSGLIPQSRYGCRFCELPFHYTSPPGRLRSLTLLRNRTSRCCKTEHALAERDQTTRCASFRVSTNEIVLLPGR